MDSMYHSTVMQRPKEEEEDSARRERNGTSSSNTRPYNPLSPTQTDFHSPFSPTNGNHPRPQFNHPYHPPTPAPLPMPTPSSHIPGPPASPRTLTAPSAYQSDYQPASRDKPTGNYYDPTSDSSERRPSESAGWSEGQTSTPQVGISNPAFRDRFPNSISDINLQSREPYVYPPASVEQQKYYNGAYTSPVAATFPPRSPVSHAHPLGRVSSISQSPRMAAVTSPDMRHNGVGLGGPVIKQEPPAAAAVRDIQLPRLFEGLN
jgi:DNA helicase INO80